MPCYHPSCSRCCGCGGKKASGALSCCPASNFQVTRRLYAIIEDLMNVLPETRQDALQRQLQVLNDTLERQHLLPENLTLARHPDRQGLGGSSTPYELQQSRRANVRGD